MKYLKHPVAGRAGFAMLILLTTLFTSLKEVPVSDLDPVGEYEMSSVDKGQSFTAIIHIEGEPGKYKGYVKRTNPERQISFTDVAVSAQNMIIVADVNTSVLVFRLYFTGDNFTGSWALGNEGNELTGKRAAK
jgi:hypothetical protein